jgi:hypothetical protein
MRLQIQPFQAEHIPLVQQFNERLANGKATYRFPEAPIPAWLPRVENGHLYQEYFLAMQNNKVRGGYILKHQDFYINSKVIPIADYQLPISEGIINSEFADVGILLIVDALKKEPKLFALGMGGYSEHLPQLLKAVRWHL